MHIPTISNDEPVIKGNEDKKHASSPRFFREERDESTKEGVKPTEVGVDGLTDGQYKVIEFPVSYLDYKI